MDHGSSRLIRDLHPGAGERLTRRIEDNAHNAPRANRLSHQQRRGQQGHYREHRDSRG